MKIIWTSTHFSDGATLSEPTNISEIIATVEANPAANGWHCELIATRPELNAIGAYLAMGGRWCLPAPHYDLIAIRVESQDIPVKRFRITSKAGQNLGLYEAVDRESAHLSMLRDAGYDGFEEAAEAMGKSVDELRGEVTIVEADG